MLRLLSVVLATSCLHGCIAGAATSSIMPSSVFNRQRCPDAEYEVVEKFQKTYRGWGLLGQPLYRRPNLAQEVNAEVGKHRGDAAIDVQVQYDYRGVIYLFFFYDLYPRYELSGKVIRFIDKTCNVEQGAS